MEITLTKLNIQQIETISNYFALMRSTSIEEENKKVYKLGFLLTKELIDEKEKNHRLRETLENIVSVEGILPSITKLVIDALATDT